MRGRGRNSPHRRKVAEAQEEKQEVGGSDQDRHGGLVPRICMVFFLSNNGPGDRNGGQAMSTKELQWRLREIRKSDKGPRQDLLKR